MSLDDETLPYWIGVWRPRQQKERGCRHESSSLWSKSDTDSTLLEPTINNQVAKNRNPILMPRSRPFECS